MADVAAIAQAFERAERRIIALARKALKHFRQTLVKDVLAGHISFFDTQDLANAFLAGLLSAYIFGRAAALGEIKEGIKKHLTFAEPREMTVDLVRLIVTKDAQIIHKLSPIVVDPMRYYFAPSRQVLTFLEGYTVKLAGVVAQDLLRHVTNLVRKTIEEGMSEREAIEYLEKAALDFTERRIKAIARTEATRAFNIGTLEETKASRVVVGYRFDAVLDERTTDICRERNGRFIPKEDVDLIAWNTPPLHVNCRSRLVPVTEFDFRGSTMPKTWPAGLMSKQRDYDVATLKAILGSVDIPQKEDWGLDDVVDTLKKLGIEYKRNYTLAEAKRIAKVVDPTNPYGDPTITFEANIGEPGRYSAAEDIITLHPEEHDFVTIVHEALHRHGITRMGKPWPLEYEEAVVDAMAKYIAWKMFPQQVWYAGYTREALWALTQAARKGGIGKFVKTAYRVRAQGKNFDELKQLWETMGKDDYAFLASFVEKNEKKFRKYIEKYAEEEIPAGSEAYKHAVNYYVEKAKDPKQLQRMIEYKERGAWYVSHAIQMMLLDTFK